MSKASVLPYMIDTLSSMDESVFGRYAIENDLLYRKIPVSDYDELIFKAIACGREYALKVIDQAQSQDARKIAKYLGINVVDKEGVPGAKRLVFATFTTPNRIEITKAPLEKTASLTKAINQRVAAEFSYEKLYSLLLAHETFHFIENKYKEDIYTQKEKILLWKAFKFENRSNLRVLSEIAAMSFAKTVSGVDYSPFILDIIMHYPYDKVGATATYERILEIADSL